MESKTLKSIYDLEYNKLNNPETIQNLNKLLASYQIYAHKLRAFHWNVVGKDYYHLRQKFKELQEKAFCYIDEIAERIRISDQTPVILLDEMLQLSIIEENDMSLDGVEMVREILKDILSFLSFLDECLKTALDLGEYGTEEMAKEFIREMEKDHRSLLSWLK